jgi:hypothetical protein
MEWRGDAGTPRGVISYLAGTDDGKAFIIDMCRLAVRAHPDSRRKGILPANWKRILAYLNGMLARWYALSDPEDFMLDEVRKTGKLRMEEVVGVAYLISEAMVRVTVGMLRGTEFPEEVYQSQSNPIYLLLAIREFAEDFAGTTKDAIGRMVREGRDLHDPRLPAFM